jgi:DNA-binding IclR family transcriptional regulator
VTESSAETPSRDGDIQAVTRCAEILRMLATDHSVRAADVATQLGLQRSTAHRYLSSMANGGLIERGDAGTFEPGPIAVHLGAAAMRRERVLDVAAPFMSALTAESHETVVLSLWSGRGAVVARVEVDTDRLAVVSVPEGRQLPLNAAQSLVFLAYLPDRQLVERLLNTQTAPARQQIERGIEQVQADGIGAHSVLIQGIHAIAAPLFDARGIVCASIALIGTSDSLASSESHLRKALRATAEQISTYLGHAADNPIPDAVHSPGPSPSRSSR